MSSFKNLPLECALSGEYALAASDVRQLMTAAQHTRPPVAMLPSGMASITLTREQLFNRAWSTPIETLARELGLSGRGLGKLCARYDIPVPLRGYWAKKAAGKRVPQPQLPPSTNPYKQKITFDRSRQSSEDETRIEAQQPLSTGSALIKSKNQTPSLHSWSLAPADRLFVAARFYIGKPTA